MVCVEWKAPDVSKNRSASIFKGQNVNADVLNLEDWGTTILRNVGNHSPNDASHTRWLNPQSKSCPLSKVSRPFGDSMVTQTQHIPSCALRIQHQRTGEGKTGGQSDKFHRFSPLYIRCKQSSVFKFHTLSPSFTRSPYIEVPFHQCPTHTSARSTATRRRL
jgi:hypothetical protein